MTSPLDKLTKNPMRSRAILSIVREALDEGDATLEKVQIKADGISTTFGEIGADEFAAAVELLRPAEFEADEPTGMTVMPVEPALAAEAGAAPTPQTERGAAPEMTRDEANAHLQSLKDQLHIARQERVAADDAVQAARAAMAQAILGWNTGAPTYDQIRRNELAAINADRQAKSPRQRRGVANSYFDQVGAYGRGDANTFVRRSHTPGQPWRGGNRGSLPLSMLRGPLNTKGGAKSLGPSTPPDNTK